jgi:hypothetical protein
MADQEVSVKLSADIKSFLQGMKDAQEHTEKAVSGMKGDLGALIESFEHFGGAALAVGAAGLAMEGLKEAMEFIKEATHETNELAEGFHKLEVQTGLSLEKIGEYNATVQLAGGKLDDLQGWIMGGTRALKSNEEVFIANGIAASHAELMQMGFGERLAKSIEVIEGTNDSGKKLILMQELLGRAGVQSYPQMKRFVEMLGEGKKTYEEVGAAINEEVIQRMHKMEEASGQLSVTWQKTMSTMAVDTSAWSKMLAGALDLWNQFTEGGARGGDPTKTGDGTTLAKPPGEHHEQKETKVTKTKEELAEEKKAAEERVKARKAADDEIIRSADHVFQEASKNNKELVAIGAITDAEMAADLRQSLKARLADQMKAIEDEKKLMAGKPAELAQVLAKEREIQQKYLADLLELGHKETEAKRKAEEQAKADAEKAAKQKLELAKLTAQNELDILRTVQEEKSRQADNELAAGRLNEAQWVAMKKAGIAQELRAQLDALNTEQKAAKDDLVAWQKIENQKDALTRKSYLEMGKLDQEAVNASRARWSGFFGSLTGGFDSAIQGLVKGTMTWGDAFKAVTDQALSGVISFLVRWGEEEAIKWATSLAMGSTGRVAEAEGAAAVYAVNAMGSVAAIPFYGWAMAPEVGAAAYGEGLAMAGLASAAGGWDRVPSDQVAQIHKNEMILPAHIAEPVRQMAERGGASQPIQINISALDGQDVHRVLSKHQDSLFRVIREGGKNRRL